MIVNNIDSKNSFGQIYVSPSTKIVIEILLKKQKKTLNAAFTDCFVKNWEKCLETKFADVHIDDELGAIIKGKTYGGIKRERSFCNPLMNIDNAIKNALFAEEKRMLF